MKISYQLLILAVVVSSTLTIVVILLFKKLRKPNYDANSNTVVLDQMREYLERNMYQINNRIVQNEERWKDMHHLLMQNQNYTNDISTVNHVVYSDFLKANGITPNDLVVDHRLVFILTPFHPEFDEDYRFLREIFNSKGYKCLRGDENFIKSDIFPEMLRLIVKARLIVANINGRNSNVLYELGIAQSLNKQVILIAKSPDGLPFDIKSKRFLIYKNYQQLADLLEKEFFGKSDENSKT